MQQQQKRRRRIFKNKVRKWIIEARNYHFNRQVCEEEVKRKNDSLGKTFIRKQAYGVILAI